MPASPSKIEPQTAPEAEAGEWVDRALAQRIVAHWRKVLPANDAKHYPFDHFHMENAFPEDVYEDMLRLKVESSQFEELNSRRWARADGTSTRDRMIMCDDSFTALDDERRRFWSTITFALKSEAFRQLVFEKLKGDIALRMDIPESEVKNTQGYVHCSLIRDIEGYRIKPHPDGWPAVVTMLFYMPEDNSRPDLGTSLYVEQGPLHRLFGKRFREVFRFPFLRNSMNAFSVNDLPNKRSIHGRELVTSDGDRNSIILTFANESVTLKNTDHVVQKTHHHLD